MSEYRYNLKISGTDAAEINNALQVMQSTEVIPYSLKVDTRDLDPRTNLTTVYLSTEDIPPYGTAPCWDKEAHERFFHELSLKSPGLMFEFTGENIDDPNNCIFMKAFHNGLYKDAVQEKQDVSSLLRKSEWRVYGEPERDTAEAEIFAMYENLSAMRAQPNFQIAYDMAYIESMIQLDTPLTDKQIYTLASSLDRACGSWMTAAVLHEETLDALRVLLEEGIEENHNPDFEELSPPDTLKLLLSADNQVFGTLVEATAVNNQIHYNEWEYQQEPEDLLAVNNAIRNIQKVKQPLNERIAAAQEKSSSQPDGNVKESVIGER